MPHFDNSRADHLLPRAAWKTRLVGREAEFGQLDKEYHNAAEGNFRVVLVTADPGLGKTRLAAELFARHRRRAIGLSARSCPLAGGTPFGLWVEALDGHLRDLSPAEVSALCGGFVDDLAGVLRAAAAVRGAAPAADVPPGRFLEGFTVLMSNLAEQAPVIAVLDDIHFADSSSWETLHYLARNLARAPVLVVATARPAQLAEHRGATQVVLNLEREERLRRLPLPPLEPGVLAELSAAVLKQPPPAALVDWLTERTRGNPLYTLGLLHALLEEGADLHRPELQSLPERLTEQVASELHLLCEPSLEVLQFLAVIGRAMGLHDLVRLAGRSMDKLGTILEELVRSRLVLEEKHGRDLRYEIAHPLIGEAIYQRISGARRVALHRLVGEALVASGRVAEAAPHYACSADVGDAEAIDVLRHAVSQAEETGAHREVLTTLAGLVALIPPGDGRWPSVLEVMSRRAEWVVDHRAEVHATTGVAAMRAIDGVLDRVPDRARQATAKFRLASFLAWGTGELEEAEQACGAAGDLFEQAEDHAGRLLAANELAWVRGLQGDMEGLDTGAREVLRVADATGERFVAVQALVALGYAAMHRGGFQEAEDALRRAADISGADGLTHQRARSVAHLAAALALQGRGAEALPLLDQEAAVDPASRDGLLLQFRALADWLSGNFPAALRDAHRARGLNSAGMSRGRGLSLIIGALSAVELDDLAAAKRYVADARNTFGDRDWSFLRHYCGYAEAVLARREGRRGEALQILDRAAGRMPASQAWPYLAFMLVELAELAGQEGEVGLASEGASRLAEIAGRIGSDLYRGLSALASAWAWMAQGSPVQAGNAAREASDFLSATSCRALYGRALDIRGRALAGSDRTSAVEALSQAASVFECCSAAWRRQQSVEMLRTLGGVGRRAAAAASGPASLTRREREVVRLAVEGRSARDIAERLYIGKRTVETHLANAYAKLGVASKIDLVRRAVEFEL